MFHLDLCPAPEQQSSCPVGCKGDVHLGPLLQRWGLLWLQGAPFSTSPKEQRLPLESRLRKSQKHQSQPLSSPCFFCPNLSGDTAVVLGPEGTSSLNTDSIQTRKLSAPGPAPTKMSWHLLLWGRQTQWLLQISPLGLVHICFCKEPFRS